MTLSRWDRLELLLNQASAVPIAQRSEFIERETSDDPGLAAELATLIEASDGAAEYVGRLRQELLGSGMEGMLREATVAGEGTDPWIGRTVSHYEILERIGGGGMGVVYRARDAKLHRSVALKFIAPEIRREPKARERFLQEARAASALDHPNICTIHEIAEADDGRLCIVMPAYDGQALRVRLDGPPLPEGDALDIARQIAQALAAAHDRGIVHRDVKPDNVFLTRSGVVKLLDFGLARMGDHRMSGPAARAGTVAYMSPEQAGGRRADARSDVWALGVILFEMLAGVRPFAADEPQAVLDQILTRDPDLTALPSKLSPEVGAVLRRALTKDPLGRFQNGRAILEALNGCRTGALPPAKHRRVAGRRGLRIGTSLVGVLGVGTVALLVRPTVDAGPNPRIAASGSVSHVLWVDDNPENNTEIIREIEGRGIQVTTALSTIDGVRRFDPALHQMVVSDMGRFEGLNDGYVERAGFDLLSQLRVRHPDVQVVFCTSARAARTYRVEAMSAGALAIVEDCSAILQLMGIAGTRGTEGAEEMSTGSSALSEIG